MTHQDLQFRHWGGADRTRARLRSRRPGPAALTFPTRISPAVYFVLAKLYPVVLVGIQLTGDLSRLRQQLWRSHAAIERLLQRLTRSRPMVQGSFYLLKR